jgi:hypothetical protein
MQIHLDEGCSSGSRFKIYSVDGTGSRQTHVDCHPIPFRFPEKLLGAFYSYGSFQSLPPARSISPRNSFNSRTCCNMGWFAALTTSRACLNYAEHPKRYAFGRTMVKTLSIFFGLLLTSLTVATSYGANLDVLPSCAGPGCSVVAVKIKLEEKTGDKRDATKSGEKRYN